MDLSSILSQQVAHTQTEDQKRLLQAIELSLKCEPIADAFSVGALIYDAAGNLLATGYSREEGDRSHAEQVAISRIKKRGLSAVGGTIYSSLEPCSKRSSHPVTCTDYIIREGIKKVVFAMKEPVLFVDPAGLNRFTDHGIELVYIPEYGPYVKAINKHLFDR